ncbi:glucosamine-6-phosphate deaminase [Corynebacterium mayonis]|uniref:glucosamine-6-phosphate deaminase n=1 Tax=Corynebacterium mayonis TaxID=3062461 RepID=UPI003140C222
MDIRIYSSKDEIAVAAADLIAPHARPGAVLGLATGSTPNPTYTELTNRYRRAELSFRGCSAFLLDEYLGLAPTHEQSYYQTIRREFTSHIDIDDHLVYSLPGDASDPQHAAAQYEAAIREAGGIDIQILGIGSNGHIAFNEPTGSLTSRTRVVQLTAQTIRDNARFFDDPADVPRFALTQGLGTIMEARRILLIATGTAKAEAVRDLIEGPVRAMVPASVLQMHNEVTVLVDEPAASLLQSSHL